MNGEVLVNLLVLMFVVLRSNDFVSPTGEYGGLVGDTGTLRCTREFLLSLQAAGDTVVIDSLVVGELMCSRGSEKTGRRKIE